MEGMQQGIRGLEKALSRSNCAWQWELVHVQAPRSGAFDFSYFADREKGVPTPCYEVAGAPLRIIISSQAWQATGRDVAAFPDEAARLLEDFPHYPRAIVTLPDPPPDPDDSIELMGTAVEMLDAEAARLNSASGWATSLGTWLRRCSVAIADAVAAVEREGDLLRSLVQSSSYQDWHINSIDQHAGTVTVMGRPMKISGGHPSGTREDLETFHIHGVISGLWKAHYRPIIRLEAADYGSCRLKIRVGRSMGASQSRWIDLKRMELVKPPRRHAG